MIFPKRLPAISQVYSLGFYLAIFEALLRGFAPSLFALLVEPKPLPSFLFPFLHC